MGTYDKEIDELYKICEIDTAHIFNVRRTINTGCLNNKLNTSYDFLRRKLSTGASDVPRKRSMLNVRVDALTYLD